MSEDRNFWGKLAGSYNKMFKASKAYKKMYDLMNDTLKKDMTILEIGTATGLVARAVSDSVKTVYAIDFSEDMINQAKKITEQDNINYEVQDSSELKFKDKFFDAVIISNVLHIVENPAHCLNQISRVLKDDGILIAPTFMWKEISLLGKIQKIIMMKKKFPIYHIWNTDEYIEFLSQNGFKCTYHKTIKNSFNICYVECKTNLK